MRHKWDLPTTVSDYWRHRRVWDRWRVESFETNTRNEHIRQRQLTIEAVRSFTQTDLRILDLCCGTGKVSADLLPLQAVREVVALDISTQALGVLTEKLADHNDRAKLTVVHADFMGEIAPAIGEFDVIICLDALHHLPNLSDALQRITKLLAPGGCFIGNFLPYESLATHVSAKKGRAHFLYGNLQAKAIRRLSFIDSLWSLSGRRGLVRFLPLSATQVTSSIDAKFELLAAYSSDYLWFMTAHKFTATQTSTHDVDTEHTLYRKKSPW